MLLPLLLSLTFVDPPETRVPPSAVELRWTAPDGCPRRADVEDELRALTNGAVVVESSAPTIVAATVTESETGFRMQLRIERHGVVETQSLESKTCATLARAVALVAGVDLSSEPPVEPSPAPTVPEQPAEPNPNPEPEPKPGPEPELPPPTPTAPPSSGEESDSADPSPTAITTRVRAIVSAEAGPSLGHVPRVTAMLMAAVGVRWARWQIDATGFHNFAASEEVLAPARLTGSLAGGGVRGCWIPTASRFEFPLCGGVALGSLRTAPSPDVQPRRVNRDLWVGATLDAAAAWALHPRFAVVLRVRGAASLRRPAVHWNVDGAQRLVFRVAPVTGALLLGPQLRLP